MNAMRLREVALALNTKVVMTKTDKRWFVWLVDVAVKTKNGWVGSTTGSMPTLWEAMQNCCKKLQGKKLRCLTCGGTKTYFTAPEYVYPIKYLEIQPARGYRLDLLSALERDGQRVETVLPDK